MHACIPAIVGMRRREIPAEIRSTFDNFSARVSYGVQALDKGALRGVIENLSDEDVAQSITDMLVMYDAITRYQPIGEHMHRNP
jgi:hypothetical protein